MHDDPNSNFENDFTKVKNTVKSASANIFRLGAAECKISMDGLTTKQMLQYMQALGTVERNRLQRLSAAFNINPAHGFVTDDAAEGGTKQIKDPMEICLRGIDLAAQGGFDKVTFDGASDNYPSIPFIQQITFPDALRLVHEAHSIGLTTYMSAGFTFKNIKVPSTYQPLTPLVDSNQCSGCRLYWS
jgi:hypothetical protein